MGDLYDFEDDILRSLKNSTRKNPVTLEELISRIDYRQHMIIMREELIPAISNLFEKGYIQEVSHLQYYLVNPPSPNQSFTGISEEEFETTVDRYQSKMTKHIDEIMDADDDWKIIVEWASFGQQSPEEAELWLDRIGMLFKEVLDDSRLFTNGFEIESGPMIGVYAVREASNVDTDQLYNQLLPLIKKNSLPPESKLQITNYYEDEEEQKVILE